MKRSLNPVWILVLLITGCVSLATVLYPRVSSWSGRQDSDSMLKVLFGDGRRLFANHFFVQADVSFHSGYYPSIFDRDQGPKDTRHLTSKEHEDEADGPHEDHEAHMAAAPDAAAEHEKQMDFLGPPKDWIEAFGRRFMITEHTHLKGGKEREMLPWLKISAELDPQRVQTYTVASYWLRDLGRFKEAEDFLREGLRNNPGNYEILFELGRLYYENYHDPDRARNVWELGLNNWAKVESGKENPDLLAFDQLAVHLAHLEESEGHLERAVKLLEMAKQASPQPEVLQTRIEELQQKLADSSGKQAAKTSP